MFLRAAVWFSYDLCWFGSIFFSGINPHLHLSTRTKEENPFLNVCLGMSAFIELAFLSDQSPVQGKAPKEGADSAMEIILCSMFLPPNNSQQHLQDQDWDWLWWPMLKGQAWLCCPKSPSNDAHWAGGERSCLGAGVKVTFREVLIEWMKRQGENILI